MQEIKIKIIELIIGGIIAIATLTGALVAMLGLRTWKKQLKGGNEYDIARRYLRSVYKLRDAIEYVRNPFISVEEMENALEKNGKDKSLSSDNMERDWAVYSVRWQEISEAKSDLDVELREAEIFWGKEAVEIQKDFQKCVTVLFLALKKFLRGDKLDEDVMNVVYDGGEKDEFNKKTELAIKKIENYLKRYLK
jgi:hypothetical protein